MSRFHRSRESGWVLAAIAMLLVGIALAILVAVGMRGLAQLFHPAILLLVLVPAALGGWFGALARSHLRHQPVLLETDSAGVTVGEGPKLPWSDLDAVIVTTIHAGYGPRETITLNRRRQPSDIAAQRAEGHMHALFTDRHIDPAGIGQTTDDVLAALDAGMAEAGVCRAEPPQRRFRLVLSSRTYPVKPCAK